MKPTVSIIVPVYNAEKISEPTVWTVFSDRNIEILN